MNIQTADGPRDFYNPIVPRYTKEHVARVTEFVKQYNNPTMDSGWTRKYMPDPIRLDEQLNNQVVLFHVPNNDPFAWATTNLKDAAQ